MRKSRTCGSPLFDYGRRWLAINDRRGEECCARRNGSLVQVVFHDAAVASLAIPFECEHIPLGTRTQGKHGLQSSLILLIQLDRADPGVCLDMRSAGGTYDHGGH